MRTKTESIILSKALNKIRINYHDGDDLVQLLSDKELLHDEEQWPEVLKFIAEYSSCRILNNLSEFSKDKRIIAISNQMIDPIHYPHELQIITVNDTSDEDLWDYSYLIPTKL